MNLAIALLKDIIHFHFVNQTLKTAAWKASSDLWVLNEETWSLFWGNFILNWPLIIASLTFLTMSRTKWWQRLKPYRHSFHIPLSGDRLVYKMAGVTEMGVSFFLVELFKWFNLLWKLIRGDLGTCYTVFFYKIMLICYACEWKEIVL